MQLVDATSILMMPCSLGELPLDRFFCDLTLSTDVRKKLLPIRLDRGSAKNGSI